MSAQPRMYKAPSEGTDNLIGPPYPSAPSITKRLMGIDDYWDVFSSGSEGDKQICDSYCKKTSDGVCSGTLNDEGTARMSEMTMASFRDWKSRFEDVRIYAMMVQSGKPSTETNADIESYCKGLGEGLRIMYHHAASLKKAPPDSELHGSTGASLCEFTKGTRDTFEFLQHDWMEQARNRDLDERLEKVLNLYQRQCHNHPKLGLDDSTGADKITSEDAKSSLPGGFMSDDWYKLEVEDE